MDYNVNDDNICALPYFFRILHKVYSHIISKKTIDNNGKNNLIKILVLVLVV